MAQQKEMKVSFVEQSQSLDFSPTESLWHNPKQAVHARKSSNVCDLKQFCKGERAEFLHSDVARYRKCLIIAVSAKIGPTSYYV